MNLFECVTNMKVIIVLICCILALKCSGEERKFLHSSITFKIVENRTIDVPCALANMENTTTIWFRNGQKIADSRNSFTETPSNLKITANHTLKISNIKRSDSGEYSCHVVSTYSNKSLTLNHLVNILYPSVIYPEPNTGGLDVELMQGFILTCDVMGNPQPKIKWYFENREIAVKNEHVVVFNVTKATKEHAGEYRCVADNSVGNPAMASFQIRILYHPEIVVQKRWIHSAIGERAEIICNVSANPRAKVDWFFENMPVNLSSKISTRIIGEKHILIIKNLKFSDFGNYTCQGTNFLGRSIKQIEISGLANPAVFKTDPRIRTETTYTLIWEVDSYSPIIQYNLRFRRQQRGDVDGNWIQIIIPAVNSFWSPIHSEMYILTGLEPASSYEAVISSRNEFGWSDISKPFYFATASTTLEEVSQDLNEHRKTTKEPITSTQVVETTEEEFQENASWATDNASTYSKVPLFILILNIILH